MTISLPVRLRPSLSLLVFLALAATAAPAAAQTTYTWTSGAGEIGTPRWLNPVNWSGGTSGRHPGVTAAGLPTDGTASDIARINSFHDGFSNGLGIDFAAAGGMLTVGAIQWNLEAGTGLAVGNTSTTTPGTLRLNGATVAGVPNVLVANTDPHTAGGWFTLANNPGNSGLDGGSAGMTVQLGTPNGTFLVSGGSILFRTSISEAAPGSGFTVRGGFELILLRPNAFSGPVRVIGSSLVISQDTGLGLVPTNPTPNHLVLEPDPVTGFRGILNTNAAAFEIHRNRGIAVGPASGTGDGEINVFDPDIPGYTATLTYNGVIANHGAGSGRLVVSGGGRLVLGGSNTFTGGTLHNGGEILLTDVNALGTTGTVTIAPRGGSFNIGSPLPGNLLVLAPGVFSRPIVVDYTGSAIHPVTLGTPDFIGEAETVLSGSIDLGNRPVTLQAGNSVQTRFTGLISGTGDLSIAATAPGRKVVFSVVSTPHSYGNLFIGQDATLQLGNGFTVIGNKLIPDTSSVTFASGARLNLAPEGTDSETLNALISPSGAGIIETVGGNSTTSFTLTIGANNGSGSFGGTIQQAAGRSALVLTKMGSGTQTLTGANTYTGLTTVAAGTLLANNTAGSATGAGTVNVVGGTLGGTGQIAGRVTVNSGGVLRAGDATASGTLTLNDGLILNSGSSLAIRINSPGASGVAAGSGESSNSQINPTNHNFLNVTGGVSSIDPGMNIVVDGAGIPFTPHVMYSYKVAQLTGIQSGVNITSTSQFSFVGFSVQSASLTGSASGAVYLNFTPVPEPTTVLAIAMAGMGLTGLARRKSKHARSQT